MEEAEEIIDFLNKEFGIKPHQTTISRLLKRLEIIYKKIKAYNDSRFWRADQIITVDESAFNKYTGYRKYG
ncbi:uncharacterized protein K444DRAFT_613727 [Hyaloscypha bicolor E]|uniref:Winged helix-turn helix domain-containing protein n=1 Tax=Hyaloscypha bicolor E TaxID=1095630 RepID=A0A2J6T7D0_9HELO|nr:uncharacterized protein K444DRAFT_613727 [Hyaloscypha bicolor E]PMD58930.1 hypothetical protein K444DRAFT_613727 [Hyaloscypha bicolor E]